MQINSYLCTVLCTEIHVLQAQLARKTQKEDAKWSHESMCQTMCHAMRHTCIILSMRHTMLEH